MLLQERNVLEEKLLLQILGAGGDHDALTRKQRRHQVGESFAGAGARLDDQVALIRQGRFHGFRHLHLARTKFVLRMPFGEHAVPRKRIDAHRKSGSEWPSG